MLGTGLIVFREVLEAALVVGIVLAASQGVPGRGRWVLSGVAGGVVVAGLVAAFTGEITAALEGAGQEVFYAAVLFAAVVMLGWHNVWMGRHGRELAMEAGAVGKAVLSGARPIYALAVAVAVAVSREGSELALLLYGMVAGQQLDQADVIGGSLIGFAAGAGVGATLYFGLLRIPLRHLFTVTSWLILLLAAGMAAQGAAFLVQADLLPALGNAIWDTSFILREKSIPGQVLHTLIGYVAEPSGIQLLFYGATLLIIGTLMRWIGVADNRPPKAAPAA
jgi:high-affinity iron transporter